MGDGYAKQHATDIRSANAIPLEARIFALARQTVGGADRVRLSVRLGILELLLQVLFALFLLRQHLIDLFLQLCAIIADGAGGSNSLGPGLIIGSRTSGRLLRFISVATDQQK